METVRILSGPTACGKSAVGLYLAKKLGADILSYDSMKLYRGLDIGTAKPDAQTRAATRHHLVDILEPWESYSVAQFMSDAEATIRQCVKEKRPLIGEGGTSLYVKSMSEGLLEAPGADEALRVKLEAEAEQIGVPKLHERLATIDPVAAKKIMPTDLRRTVRALEVHALTGKPISTLQSQWGVPRVDMDVRVAFLRMPRDILYARIDHRIDAMLAAGWLDECRRLMALPQGLSREALQALGYRTLFAHLRGEMELK
ncbi:MAG TPA: tRNA (adenosine(37)-N6)-dimethylallyltransferase MiaA, partial [Planctomycetota bacterium]|nr:tRNA (adenosine(37)-N6)-dimethylallyltransferase MiaA [Planctomycetota bacterium]